jgi:hypothetical protein
MVAGDEMAVACFFGRRSAKPTLRTRGASSDPRACTGSSEVQVRGSGYCTVLAVASVQISDVYMWWCDNDTASDTSRAKILQTQL